MQLLEGRWFNRADASCKEHAIVINADLKEKIFGKDNAIGKYIGDGDNKNKMQVIGVVNDY